MQIKKSLCPLCTHPIELSPEIQEGKIECPGCGYQINISTPDYDQRKEHLVEDNRSFPETNQAAHSEISDNLGRKGFSQTISSEACPICGNTHKMNKGTRLYGHFVCQNCTHAFANRRQIAFILDWIILYFGLGLLFVALYLVFFPDCEEEELEKTGTIINLLFPVILAFKDSFSGKSFGKKIMGLQVINDIKGGSCSIKEGFLRNILLAIPFLPLFIAFQLYGGYRTGDKYVNTKVIWLKYKNNPVFAPLEE